MELDDLKHAWKKSTENTKPPNNNIMELIKNQSYGPVAHLKKRFRRQLIILPLAVFLLINVLSKHHDLFSDMLFWFYIFICITTCGYFYYSYRLLTRMQRMDDVVKSNVEQQVQTLEKGYTWRLRAVRIAVILFVILLEALMYYQQEPSLAKWAAQPIGLRIVGYAAVWAVFYFFSRAVFDYKYGRHIRYLKNLVQQLH